MTRLICLEPTDPGPVWFPFTGARPLAELRAGVWRVWERWAAVLGAEDVAILGGHVEGFADVDAIRTLPPGPVEGPAIVARSDFAPSGPALELGPATRRLTHEGRAVAWVVPGGDAWRGPHENGEAVSIEGMPLRGAYDLVTALERFLAQDCQAFLAEGGDPVPDASIVIGDPAGVVCLGAAVEPAVVFDVHQGPVILEEGVRVRAGARLEGPLYVGPGTWILGGQVRHSAIGPHCRVHGEVTASVFLGFANKSHDGFLGHSVLGHWVNLGAGTTTSNLKNTYGEVRLDLPHRRVETGRTNLGSLVGDHAKTAIGTMLSTGTVIGVGANVVGAPVPRYVAPFAWGSEGGGLLDADGFVKIAKRVMPRRGVQVDSQLEAALRTLHARLTP